MLASSSAAQIFKAQDLLRAEIAVDFSASKRPASAIRGFSIMGLRVSESWIHRRGFGRC